MFWRKSQQKQAPQPRQPLDGAARFDPETYGCPLPPVALDVSCAQKRAKFFCPHYRQFRTVDANGSVLAMEWRCTHFQSIDTMSEIAGRLVGVQSAVETRGDNQAQRLAAIADRMRVQQESPVLLDAPKPLIEGPHRTGTGRG